MRRKTKQPGIGTGNNPASRKNLIPPQPGEVRNPEGCKTSGATVKQFANQLADQLLTTQQIKDIADDPAQPHHRRVAAAETLEMRSRGDLADFQELIDGEATLEELRERGIDTSVVKKLECTDDGIRIELRRDFGESFDRIVEQTDGLPTKTVKVEDNRHLATPEQRRAEAVSIGDLIKKLLGNVK